MEHPKLKELTTLRRFRQKVAAVLTDLEGKGWPVKIAEALRTPEQQAEKVRLGYSKTLHSKHLPGPDGLGRAVDIVHAKKGWNAPELFWRHLGSSCVAHGLGWGGFFGLPTAMRARLIADFKAGTFDLSLKRGWDVAHAESV